MEKYKNGVAWVARILAIAMTVFHLYTCIFGLLPPLLQRSVHVGFAVVLIFLVSIKKEEKLPLAVIKLLLAVLAAVTYGFLVLNWARGNRCGIQP